MKLYKDRDWMYRKYVVEKWSPYQIAPLCGAGRSTVYLWLRKHGIPVRTNDQANKLRAKFNLSDPRLQDEIRRLYVDEQLPVEEVARRIGMSKTHARRSMEQIGIANRSNSEAQKTKRTIRHKMTEWLLRRMYLDEGLSTYQIGELYGTTPNTVWRRLSEVGISSRSVVDAQYRRLENGNHVELTRELVEIIDGELLGDGCVVATSKRSGQFNYSSQYRHYLKWLREAFAEHDMEFGPVYGGGKSAWYFSSRAYPELLKVRERWYPNNEKRVPEDLELTPVICRHWYIGDGSLNKTRKFISIAAQSFPREDLERLTEQMHGFGVNARLWKSQFGYGFVVGILKTDVPTFLDYIGPCPKGIMDCYGYKWGYSNVA